MDLDNLIERLMNLTYRDKSDKYDFHVISESNNALVSNEIRSWASEQVAKYEQEISENRIRLSELESKVFVYEAIIKNSNFAPIIQGRKKEILTNKNYEF